MTQATGSKVKTRNSLVEELAAVRVSGKSIGYTSGVFDLVHPGHVDSLQKARALCDYLIVGLNSNSSVKQYKDQSRPIVDAHDRAMVISAFDCVDAVFIFDERNNNKNIEILQPDIYIKAGDYDKSQLSSTPIVESYGGKVEIVPYLQGYSSTSIIEKIETLAQISLPEPKIYENPAPAVFLDRDGTLVKDVDHLHEPEKMLLFPDVIEGLLKLRQAGFRLVICTNQAGIGLGYFTKEDFFAVSRKMLKQISAGGAFLDKIYFSPYTDIDKSAYHKPAPGMLTRAAQELNLNLEESFMIGDTSADIGAASAAGCKSILVLTGKTQSSQAKDLNADYTARNFSEAVSHILKTAK
ncbi:MAG: HAD-IIIA family hydrolase [Bdellovibrionota bacterium]